MVRRLLFLLPFALPAAAHAQLDRPWGGWQAAPENAPYTQPVYYPAVAPSVGDSPEAAQIRGEIASKAKVATLIVNGTAMPVRVDEGGHFERPYRFGSGMNSVEVRTPEERLATAFFQTAGGQPDPRLRLVLSWDTDGTDLDLHVITPDGQHAWYGNRVVPGGALDVDVTTGFGPEIFTSTAPERGLYQAWVNYFGDGGQGGLTTARLTVITNEGTPDEKREEFTIPMRFAGELVPAAQFVLP
jgi:uncharacterized protein YfaP (DUF2135 family)